jgi:hypothetical protein
MAENDYGEQFRDLISLMEKQRQSGQDANDIWWQNQEAMEERSSLPSGFFADAEAKVLYFRDEMREMRERIREEMYNIEDGIRETVDSETPEYKEYVRQYEVEEQRWMAHEDWLRSGGKEGEPHYQFLDGKQPEEALQAYQEEQQWRQEGYAQQENEQQVANEAAQGRQRGEATMQLQAFDGKTPEEQQQIYIRQVTEDAITTGREEGYPIRDRAELEKQIAVTATTETVQAYTDALRDESMMSNSEERTQHVRQVQNRLKARYAAQQSLASPTLERDEGISY